MRTAALALAFVATCCATNAQKFSLLPQVGFENSKTVIQYNDQNSFAPLGVEVSPQLSLRLNFASKQGHGFFVGAASSRSIVLYSFNIPEDAMATYNAAADNLQLRFEGGYQFNSPKINLGKSKQSSTSKSTANKEKATTSYTRTYSCQSRCGSYKTRTEKTAPAKKATSWVRIQPSIGMGFIPSVKQDMNVQSDGAQSYYEYRAGNWSTALITGANFEFGKGSKGLFTIGVNYFNGMGNLDKQSITTVQGTKTTTTTFQSDVSGWNLRIGIPLSLSKSKSAKTKAVEQKSKPQNRCNQYRTYYRCGRSN